MTTKLNMRVALRLALFTGVSSAGILISMQAVAQETVREESSVHFLRYGSEVADSGTTVSEARDVLMARARVGDRSLLIYDRQNGAVTVERGGRTRVIPEINRTASETSFAYDYMGQHVRGAGNMPSDFDTYVRPHLSRSAPLGTNANWSIPTSLATIGITNASDAPVAITINRTYLRSDGKDVVLIEFDVPVFEYVTGGETVVQWGRGFAVTDPGFGEIYVLATQHRASVLSVSGDHRPVSVRTTLHGIERNGDWRMTFADQPAARIMESAGDMTHTFVRGNEGGVASVPVALAARIDLVAFSAAENSANSIAATLEASQPEPAPPPPAAEFDPEAMAEWLNDPYNFNTFGARELTPEQLANFKQSLREAGLDLGFDQEKVMAQHKASMEMSTLMLQTMKDAFGPPDSTAEEGPPNSTTKELDILVAAMAAGALQPDASVTEILEHLDAARSGAFDGGFVPWLQNERDQSDGTIPDWLTEEAAGDVEVLGDLEAGYRTLLERLDRELNEAQRDAERDRQQPRSIETADLGDADQFFANNAFAYTSMVGIIPTDLSRWAEWLATQNVRDLERLARTAGYPNLASALADSKNILRQSQDEGYRKWALQAPSCGGYVGCGPSYLERWHMKTSIVALGDILNSSRDIFSTGGFSDIGISGLNLSYLLRDNALEDGDIVRVRITQFGRTIYEGEISLTNIGNLFNLGLGRGVASLEIFAVNEGTASPNTAQISVDNVVRGQGTQSYSLRTGETATLRIEAGATASAGGPQ